MIVEKDETALVFDFYSGVRQGRIDAKSLLAAPPGFKRGPDGLVAMPLKIEPIQIAALNEKAANTDKLEARLEAVAAVNRF